MKFDMEMARAICSHGGFRMKGDTIEEGLNNLVDQVSMLPAALDRILELESALIEERAKLLYFAHAGDGEYCPDVIEEADSLKDRHLENAREDLQSEGKI